MSTRTEQIFNFAFLDLETTGLPSEEHNRTRITELNITVIESKHISSGEYPRVRNKLNLCFNPEKLVQPKSTELTGLSNDILENQSPFTLDVINTINHFLNIQKMPICLVAHYGDKFDYPILKAEIMRSGGTLNENILCMDSLICFKDLHYKRPQEMCSSSESISTEDSKTSEVCDEDIPVKKQKISFKLGEIYKRLTSKIPLDSHQAEADVEYLIQCASVYGKYFVDWANDNAKLFSTIPEMKPGKKIGC
ncbi:hypothetical protein WA026_018487 [Henosepilachna vigintioctopunctata]|uniref:Exonuclease domain-containing protein n=1 Tax=Henosepilachna vigintioctopunctata TaxID=420089 RepID=A0AAW1V262_9CUCU